MMSSSISKFSNNEIEGPEELHLFYVNIYHNNKKLAYKFDKSSFRADEIGSEEL
jgi:hypothetical protein